MCEYTKLYNLFKKVKWGITTETNMFHKLWGNDRQDRFKSNANK